MIFDIAKAIEEALFWSEIAGMPYSDPSFTDQKREAYREELKEFIDARFVRDEVKIIDGAFDTFFTHINYAASRDCSLKHTEVFKKCFLTICKEFAYVPQKVWNVGIENNMSKFIRQDQPHEDYTEEVRQTQNHYYQLGVRTKVRSHPYLPYSYIVTTDETQTDRNGKEYFPKKILKPITWHEPDWSKAKAQRT